MGTAEEERNKEEIANKNRTEKFDRTEKDRWVNRLGRGKKNKIWSTGAR